MLIIDREALDRVFTMADAFEAVAEAARAWVAGTVDVPPRAALHAPANGLETLVMPGMVAGSCTGAKLWYAAGPEPGRLEGSSALILIFDQGLGEVLLDGELITDLRTGAMTGLAAAVLAPRGAATVGIVGAGIQARTQALALAHALPELAEVRISSRDPRRREAFVDALRADLAAAGSNAVVVSADSPEHACRGADVIVAATTASTPVIDDAWVGDETLVCGVGSHDPHSAELSPETVARAGVVVVDTAQGGIDAAGDVSQVIAAGRLDRDEVLELGRVLDGLPVGHAERTGPRVLKTVGFAAADLIAARAAAQRAIDAGLARSISVHRAVVDSSEAPM